MALPKVYSDVEAAILKTIAAGVDDMRKVVQTLTTNFSFTMEEVVDGFVLLSLKEELEVDIPAEYKKFWWDAHKRLKAKYAALNNGEK